MAVDAQPRAAAPQILPTDDAGLQLLRRRRGPVVVLVAVGRHGQEDAGAGPDEDGKDAHEGHLNTTMS
jgi:hypothetical protein